jgi:hypothetical protein
MNFVFTCHLENRMLPTLRSTYTLMMACDANRELRSANPSVRFWMAALTRLPKYKATTRVQMHH